MSAFPWCSTTVKSELQWQSKKTFNRNTLPLLHHVCFSLWPPLCVLPVCIQPTRMKEVVRACSGKPLMCHSSSFSLHCPPHVLCWESPPAAWLIRGVPTLQTTRGAQPSNKSTLASVVVCLRWDELVYSVEWKQISCKYVGRDSWKGNEPPHSTWLTHLRRVLPFNADAKCKQRATGWVLFNHPCLGG